MHRSCIFLLPRLLLLLRIWHLGRMLKLYGCISYFNILLPSSSFGHPSSVATETSVRAPPFPGAAAFLSHPFCLCSNPPLFPPTLLAFCASDHFYAASSSSVASDSTCRILFVLNIHHFYPHTSRCVPGGTCFLSPTFLVALHTAFGMR